MTQYAWDDDVTFPPVALLATDYVMILRGGQNKKGLLSTLQITASQVSNFTGAANAVIDSRKNVANGVFGIDQYGDYVLPPSAPLYFDNVKPAYIVGVDGNLSAICLNSFAITVGGSTFFTDGNTIILYKPTVQQLNNSPLSDVSLLPSQANFWFSETGPNSGRVAAKVRNSDGNIVNLQGFIDYSERGGAGGVAGLDSNKYVQAQGITDLTVSLSVSSLVTKFNNRASTGNNIVPTTGDYTKAMITNLADTDRPTFKGMSASSAAIYTIDAGTNNYIGQGNITDTSKMPYSFGINGPVVGGVGGAGFATSSVLSAFYNAAARFYITTELHVNLLTTEPTAYNTNSELVTWYDATRVALRQKIRTSSSNYENFPNIVTGAVTSKLPTAAPLGMAAGEIAHYSNSGIVTLRKQTGASTFVDINLEAAGTITGVSAIANGNAWGGSNAFTNGGTAFYGNDGVAIGGIDSGTNKWALMTDNKNNAYANTRLFVGGDCRSVYATAAGSFAVDQGLMIGANSAATGVQRGFYNIWHFSSSSSFPSVSTITTQYLNSDFSRPTYGVLSTAQYDRTSGKWVTHTFNVDSYAINGAFNVNGAATCTGGVWANAPSDPRAKDDIEYLSSEHCFDAIDELMPASFKWKQEFVEKGFSEGTQYGLITTDLLSSTHFEDQVLVEDSYGLTDFKKIKSPKKMEAYTLGTVIELKKRCINQEDRIKELSKQISKIQEQLSIH